jgi:glycosyltransferase involved in cell wall biosynthesis
MSVTQAGSNSSEMRNTSPESPGANDEEIARRLSELCGAEAGVDRITLCENLIGAAACRQLGIFRIPPGFRLSVVIPVFNEMATLAKLVERVRQCGMPTQIVLVDDASTDGSRQLLETWRDEPGFTIILQSRNQGKGAALRAGFAAATGDVVAIQDADLEYDPSELPRLAQPIIEGQADVVFGSRFRGDNQRVLYFWHYVGNRVLTLLSNAFTNLNLSDMETCYKLFRRDVIQQLTPRLRENRFGIEPEITAKVAAIPNVRIHERPISYAGRTYAEGKKITWRDGFRALWCIVRYRNG